MIRLRFVSDGTVPGTKLTLQSGAEISLCGAEAMLTISAGGTAYQLFKIENADITGDFEVHEAE